MSVLRQRVLQYTDEKLARAARTLAGSALTPSDSLLGIEVGNLRRVREDGRDKPIVTPKPWARAMPITRGLTIVTYTPSQVLFLGDGFGVNCPIAHIYRAELHSDRYQVFVFERRESSFSIVELEPARRNEQASGHFLEHLLATRDEERSKFPPKVQEGLKDLDRVVQSLTVVELWQAPPYAGPLLAAELRGRQDPIHDDGLDEPTWAVLGETVIAAHQGNAAAFTSGLHRFEEHVSPNAQPGAYLLYLLRYRIAEQLGRRPTTDDLRQIAEQHQNAFNVVIRDGHLLEAALRTAFDLSSKDQDLTGSRFAVAGAAALGVLLRDPAAEMMAMRPTLANWWQRWQQAHKSGD